MQDSPELRKWEQWLDKKLVRFTNYSFHGMWLECKGCGHRWSPMIQPGGKLPRCYWKCTNCYAADYR